MIEEIKKFSDPYGLDKINNKVFDKLFLKLTKLHIKNNKKYKKFLHFFKKNITKIEDIQPLPVRIFKKEKLVNDKVKVTKMLSSSGTSGDKSNIYLDKDNSYNQIYVLTKIITEFLGGKRLPMLIFDQKPKRSNEISASIAAINGFSIFGRDHTFALDEKGNLNIKDILNFIKKYTDEKKFIFGFTSNIYKYLIENKIQKKFTLDNSILLHGGGWKKLESKKIEKKLFNKILKSKLKIKKVINYYGLVEQTGSIFVECSYNFFHCSNYSTVFTLDQNFNKLKFGEQGYLQLLSLLPTSYPGHNILTEDIGIIHGENDCKCGKGGKYFKVLGRIKKAELRGCSDTKI